MTKSVRINGACEVSSGKSGQIDLATVASGANEMSPVAVFGIVDGFVCEKVNAKYNRKSRLLYPDKKFESYFVYFTASYSMSSEAFDGFKSVMYKYSGDDWTVTCY